MAFKEALIIILIAAVLALLVNAVSPSRIPYLGQYRDLHSDDGPVVPPTSEPGDPPFIAIDVAELDFSMKAAVFIDAREIDEFECGTIPGALNIPFDCLPEGDLGPYFDSCLAGLGRGTRLVTFCSGEECDLSLHLARNMQAVGYSNLAIFFGGAREWERFGLDMERRRQCAD